MDTLFPALVLGAGQGGLDALLALGIVLIYRTTRVLNFAQAATGTCATFVTYSAAGRLPLAPALAAGIAAGAVIGILTHLAVRGAGGRNTALSSAVATLAVAVLLQQVVRIGWGSAAGEFPNPFGAGGWTLGSVVIPYINAASLGAAALLALALGGFLTFTKTGTMTRALADNPEGARLSGAPVGLLLAAVWAAAGALSAVAGFFAAQITFDPFFLDPFFLVSLVAAVIAGLRSLPGAFVAAIGVEVAYNLFQTYAPAGATPFTNTFLLLVLLAVLLASRPGRLLAAGRQV